MENGENYVTRVVIPFKDQDSAYIAKTQFKDRSIKFQTTVQPEFVSRKIGQDLQECDTKPQLVNQQCVVIKGAMLDTRAGKHFDNDHAGAVPEDLLSCFKVLKKCRNKFDCLVNKLLYIKQLTPRWTWKRIQYTLKYLCSHLCYGNL